MSSKHPDPRESRFIGYAADRGADLNYDSNEWRERCGMPTHSERIDSEMLSTMSLADLIE